MRNWLRSHHREVKRTGQGVRFSACRLPSKSPWPNPIEPKCVHGKRAIAEPARPLSADGLEQRSVPTMAVVVRLIEPCPITSLDYALEGLDHNVFKAHLSIDDKHRKVAFLQVVHPGAHGDLVVDVDLTDRLVYHQLQRIVLIGLER